jgi:hypothetical protein
VKLDPKAKESDMDNTATETPPAGPPLGLSLHDGLGLAPERAVVAYLYHDAPSAEQADPLWHSTFVVMARDRQNALRNETPLVTLAHANAMVAAERERWRAATKDALDWMESAWERIDGEWGPGSKTLNQGCADGDEPTIAALRALLRA